MSIELRILSGTRAGQSESFEKPVIAVGRHPLSDLRFDATRDLDVSTRHGEIRVVDGRYSVLDQESTNGTFVNGEHVPAGGERELRDGDVIAFGAHGPTVSVRISGGRTTPIGDRITQQDTPAISTVAVPSPAHAQRRPTTERVAIAVEEKTRKLRLAVTGAVVLLGGLAFAASWMGRRQSAEANARVQALAAANVQAAQTFETRMQGMRDTALIYSLRRTNDSLLKAIQQARGGEQVFVAQQALERSHDLQRRFSEMDLPAVRDANDAAIVLIIAEVGGKNYEATGFSVNAAGLIVTNRHVVAENGAKATRLAVKFANTAAWKRARLVKLGDSATADLALIQMEDPATYPAVQEISATVDTPVGSPIATLGFPLGTDVAMEGSGNALVAKTTLTVGTVSKSIDNVLQIDSFASHGSSGSPVFDMHGHVIGVVWGGPPGAAGRIVYAVPASRIAELIRSAK
jgi:S1-C subfamily serine protease